jgi:hypothetical protein
MAGRRSSILVMDGAPFSKVAMAQTASLSLIVVSLLDFVTAVIFYVVHPDDTKEVLLVPLDHRHWIHSARS